MAPEEPFLQLSLWMGNFCVKSYTFCLYFILNLSGGSGSTKLLNMDSDPQHWFYYILGCTIFFIFRNIIIIKKRMVFLSCTNLGFLSLATFSCREWAPITFVPFAWNCFNKKKYYGTERNEINEIKLQNEHKKKQHKIDNILVLWCKQRNQQNTKKRKKHPGWKV